MDPTRPPRSGGRPSGPARRGWFGPRLEALDDRWLPSTLAVTSTQDSGAGSLRAEIAAAQSSDTIVFSPKRVRNGKAATITLTSGELNLAKNLTIQGPGAGQLTISGNWSGLNPPIHGQVNTTPPREYSRWPRTPRSP